MKNKIEKNNVNLQNKSILLVENDYSNYFLVSEIFEDTKIQIVWAKTGIEALNFCKDNIWFDLILIDNRLPILSGIDTMIKLLQYNPKYKIIGLTAINNEDEFRIAGAIDFILKPIFEGEIFRNKILNYINL